MSVEPARLIEAAQELLKQCGYFVDNLWHVDDIHFLCEQLELTRLTEEEAMQVFAIANERFDGETGLSWPKVEEATRAFLERKQVLSTFPKIYEAAQDAP